MINSESTATYPEAVGRQIWLDVARGIGILLVVIGHVMRGCVTAGVVQPTIMFRIEDYSIYIFHMPLFFLLSGVTNNLYRPQRAKYFFFTKVPWIFYAYTLWSIIQVSLQTFFIDYVNHPMSLKTLITILYKPVGQFWFLYALLLCQFFSLVIGKRPLVLVCFAIITTLYPSLGLGSLAITSAGYYFAYYAVG